MDDIAWVFAYLKDIKDTGSTARKPDSGRPKSASTQENKDMKT